jgi:hypothetical protein
MEFLLTGIMRQELDADSHSISVKKRTVGATRRTKEKEPAAAAAAASELPQTRRSARKK